MSTDTGLPNKHYNNMFEFQPRLETAKNFRSSVGQFCESMAEGARKLRTQWEEEGKERAVGNYFQLGLQTLLSSTSCRAVGQRSASNLESRACSCGLKTAQRRSKRFSGFVASVFVSLLPGAPSPPRILTNFSLRGAVVE